jgi:Uma2 family endonuclease
MSQQLAKLITAEELFEMGDIGRCELIKGEIIHMAPASAEHGDIAMEIARLIANHVKSNKLGKVFAAETGFIIARSPDTTRAPDVAFLRKERVPAKFKRGFFDGPPDLAVEVVSPSDTHSELAAKVDDWLSAGTTSVWVVDPPNRTIEVYRAHNHIRRYTILDSLDDEPLLPQFSLSLKELFEQ